VFRFFPEAISCSLTAGEGNNFCCPKGGMLRQQPCCQQFTCACTFSSPCVSFTPTPDRCVLLDIDQYANNTACMTESTLDDEPAYDTQTSGFNQPLALVDNFTIAFWARAREPLNFSQLPSLSSSEFVPRGAIFTPLLISNDGKHGGLGFYLGTDGYVVMQTTMNGTIVAAQLLVVQPQSLIGWHHYSIVCDSLQPSVYIDGNSQASGFSIANSIVSKVGFRPVFGRTRGQYNLFRSSPNASYGVGFEGWISE
jgi:hypothetical protein